MYRKGKLVDLKGCQESVENVGCVFVPYDFAIEGWDDGFNKR